ncbi:MAG: DUF488 domain-containing protein [Hyphomicrobiales bacterium]
MRYDFTMITVRRIYAPARSGEGRRILVDRLWPRGIARKGSHIDEWLKDVAPSTELRKWFGHDPARWAGFRKRYAAELKEEPGHSALDHLRRLAKEGPLTLLYAARDERHNNAVALRELLGGE